MELFTCLKSQLETRKCVFLCSLYGYSNVFPPHVLFQKLITPSKRSGVLASPILKSRAFPGSSVGKESTCNAGDPNSIPGSGRSAGEAIGFPLQYSWVSLVAQLVKNPSAMWETWVQSLGWEDLMEKGKATHSSILAWKIPWTM